MDINLPSQSNLHWILSRYLHRVNHQKLIHPTKDYPVKFRRAADQDASQALCCEPVEVTQFLRESRATHLISQDETFVLKIPNGKFLDDASYIIDNQFGYIFRHQSIDSVYGANEWIAQQATASITDKIQLKGNVLLLNSTWGGEYAHFVFNVLGKLRKFLSFPVFLDSIDYIIFPEKKKFIEEWIDILKLPKHKIVYIPSSGNSGHPGVLVEAENLFVPSSAAVGDLDTIAFIRNALLSQQVKKPANLLIYSSRIKNVNLRGRHILNEDELFNEILKPLGFIYVIDEDLTIQEKAELYYQAKVVITPMGSGSVTHLSYMQAGSVALEIMGEHWVDYLNGDIMHSLGIHYFYHITHLIEGANIRIDKEKFRLMVDKIKAFFNF